ncbi:MAG TPA: DUF2007 domain-containing protein [Anaerolineales bacterium]|nr:DUF2007 domain-containing protein [Anaerolineales bacterium]
MSENKFVVLDTVTGDLKAEMLRGLLEAQGVRVVLSKEGYARALGLNVGPLGEVEILVRSDQLPLARQVLNDYYSGVFANSELLGVDELAENNLGETDDSDGDLAD